MSKTVRKTDAQWREELTQEQYRVMRQKGTEAPYSGEFVHKNDAGEYRCAGCNALLFNSDAKYTSDIAGLAGWPSFSEAVEGSVEYKEDTTHGMIRTEVVCATCGAHLGHVFDDKSSPNGKHYCINSVCLGFQSASKK